jgi:hypothetical protein
VPRTRHRPRPTHAQTLTPVATHCPACGHLPSTTHARHRTVTPHGAVTRLTLRLRCGPNPDCSRYRLPYPPEAEALLALPHQEFGLDVLARVGRLRYAEHRSVPEIHHAWTRRGVRLALPSVTNRLDRSDELRARATADRERCHALPHTQRRVVLASDGVQPDVGHAVLGVLRDCLCGEVRLARRRLSSTAADLAALLTAVRPALPVPIIAAVADGPDRLRKAVAQALPGVPHQPCHFPYLREAAQPLSEADRHAHQELTKRRRDARRIERKAEPPAGAAAEVVRGYGAAVRAALTDDGRPPLAASALKRHERLTKLAASLDRVVAKAR